MKYFIVVFFLILTSCTEKEKKCEINCCENFSEDTVYLYINISIKKNDIIRMYYIPEGKNSFEDKVYLENKIFGSESSQIIKFEFPKSVYLHKIRLDISEIRQIQKVTINNITFLYEGKCFLIEDEFEYFFKANHFIIKDKLKTNSYKTKELENKYDPHFLSKNLIDIMDFLLYKD